MVSETYEPVGDQPDEPAFPLPSRSSASPITAPESDGAPVWEVWQLSTYTLLLRTVDRAEALTYVGSAVKRSGSVAVNDLLLGCSDGAEAGISGTALFDAVQA